MVIRPKLMRLPSLMLRLKLPPIRVAVAARKGE